MDVLCGDPIAPSSSVFPSIWNRLKAKGWHCKTKAPGSSCIVYCAPHVKKPSKGILGSDVFEEQSKLIEYVESAALLSDSSADSDTDELPESPVAAEPSRRARRGKSEDITAEFNEVYRELKYRGWKHVKGDGCHDFFYLMPGIKGKSAGTRHRNVLTMEEVVMWARANPTLDVSSYVSFSFQRCEYRCICRWHVDCRSLQSLLAAAAKAWVVVRQWRHASLVALHATRNHEER